VRQVLACGLLALSCATFAAPERAWRERPYVWAHEGRVELLSCRWTLDAPIGVSVNGNATPEEEHALDAALRAWEATLPGLRLPRAGAGSASIRVSFLDAPVQRADGTLGTGRTVADCRLDAAGARAALVAASVEISRRTPPDWRGRERALSPEERTGALVHELGHALGVAGHAEAADDPLRAGPEAARRAGARALAGEPLASPSLAGLYARAPGELLASAQVEEWRTVEVDRLATLARAHELDGPYLRAGDAVGRIFWRDEHGREWGFLVAGLAQLARHPTQLLLLPEASTRGALPRRSGGLTP
jgi:hypothetical protein